MVATLVTPRAFPHLKIDDLGQSGRELGDRIVTSMQTRIVCGTVIIVACIGALVYVVGSGRPPEAALAFMAPIVAAVVASCFGVAKLDRIEQRVELVRRQTNGQLREAVERIVEERLSATGQDPLPGRSVREDV